MDIKTWELEKFETKLSQAVSLLAEVSGLWENLNDDENNKVIQNYPFEKSFDEVVAEFIKWKSDIKNK